ncbi:DMT family transporter [Chengkuizengella axinellae]|uniref:DMT family transporter n=1 Tax=Chengkuizengella axinellae TaxID=3064388 RepID=A0ABT9J3Y2_9BACL|nr:DMT family transporter [Chengkuizengella sp. 2205SS18-9]MDP5276293.1 DMT family transporter [Chengkuizengella sp. 2205SS18-9]
MATISMIIAMSIFGSIGFIAVQTGLQAFELVFVRCVFASLFLGAFWLLTGKFKDENWDMQEIKRVLLCGVILVLNWVFLFKAFEMMSITVAISIYYLAPVIVLLLGSLFYKEKLTWIAISSILICFIGTMLISGLGTDTPFHQLLSSGLVWPFLAAILYALLTLLSKGIQQLSPYAVTVIQTTLGSILLFPLVSFGAFSGLQFHHWIAITIIGVIHTGVVYLLFFGSVRFLPTRLISVLVFLDPIVAILLDTMIIGFRPSILQMIGILLTFTGMGVIITRNHHSNTKT